MLHNTGTFGHNEVPINQNNQNSLSSQSVNITSNNNLAKNHQPAQTHYNVAYNNYAVNAGQYNPGFEASAHKWQSGMLPMNLNVQNESVLSFQSYEKPETIIDYKGHAKNTLNVPQVYTKAYHKQIDIEYNYFNNSNYDVNNVNRARTYVKESSESPAEAPSLSKQEDRLSCNYSKMQTNILTKVSQEPSYQIELDLSQKPINNVNTDSITDLSNKLLKDNSRKRLENTVKIIENIISHPSNSRKTKRERDIKTEDSEDLSETSDAEFISCNKINMKPKNNIQRTSIMKKQTNRLHYKKLKMDSFSCSADGEVTDKGEARDAFVVKAEIVPAIFNIEQFNPFLNDTYGVHGEQIKSYDVIGAESSINVAKEIIKNGASIQGSFFECPHCKLFFNNPKRFLIHTKWHTFGYVAEKKLRSQKERIVRPRSRKYKMSETNDSAEEGVIPCGDCSRTFNSTPSLLNHKRKYHPTRLRECKICGKTMVGLDALRAHIATHTTESKFQCADCPKWFKYAHSLAKHRDTHLEKTQGCPQCPKKFGSVALLNVHMKSHERVLRGATFRCTYCGKGFFESYSLQAHERTHRNERPFICDICNTSFGTNSSLKRHLKVSHSTSKPYECSTCHRSFVSESIRDRHAIRYHGDPNDFKFVCKLCPCKYLNARELRRHVYKVHPKPKMKIEVESD